MNSIERVRKRIAELVAGSNVLEDASHSHNTLKWLLELEPDADAALRIAALGHDVERATETHKVRREDFADYDAFKAAHARRSADILREIMCECGVENEALIREVQHLVCLHEMGGDPRSDLLRDADGLSFFDVNLLHYFERNGREETRRRCVWGYRRLSERARSIASGLAYSSDELKRLVETAIREAESGARSRC
jgi:hypothetical protein